MGDTAEVLGGNDLAFNKDTKASVFDERGDILGNPADQITGLTDDQIREKVSHLAASDNRDILNMPSSMLDSSDKILGLEQPTPIIG